MMRLKPGKQIPILIILMILSANLAFAQEEPVGESPDGLGLIILLIGIIAVGIVGGIILVSERNGE